MARPHVPKFGTWDPNTNGPAYTAVFDSARAGKGGKPFNPNDPSENEALASTLAPPQRSNERLPPPRGRMATGNNDQDEAPVARPRHERRSSREDIDVRRSNDQLPARRTPAGGEGRYGGRGGTAPSDPPPRRVVDRDGNLNSERGNNEGSGHNSERSPVHPYASRVGARESGRGSASPAWDRRGRQPSGDEGSVFAPGTPKNNSRLRTQGVSRPEEPPAKGGALPKFGAWDVKDPSSGDGFTMIFQKASTEKKEGGPVHIPRLNNDSPAGNAEDYNQKQNQPNAPRKKQPDCGCTIL